MITFPKSHYIGIVNSRRSGGKTDQLPLGFMTPWGEDSSAKKRIATVDNWVVSNSSGDTPPKAAILPNEPVGGFCLLDAVVRSSRYNSSVKFRIEDPRGFEVEISAHNLMSIMTHSVIDKGEILDMCVWGRDKSENVLVPVSSPLYNVMQDTSARISRTVSLKELQQGDYVVMHNSYAGRYIGKYYELDHDYSHHSDWGIYKWRASKKPKWVFLHDNQVNVLASPPKLSEISVGEPISQLDGLRLINQFGKFSIDQKIEQKYHVEATAEYKTHSYCDPKHNYVIEYQGSFWVIAAQFQNDYRIHPIDRGAWEGHQAIIVEKDRYNWAKEARIPSIAGLPMWVRTHSLTISTGDVIAI